MKTNKLLMVGALAFSMVLSGGMLTGCSNSSNTKDTKTSEVTKKKEVKTIGQKTKDSKSLKITNTTGKKITVFETKSSSEESFSDNLLENGDVVKNKEECTLYYEVKENDKLDVKIGLQDQDKAFVFKDVDTTDTKKVDVSLKDDKVNLDVTKKDGSEVKQEEKKEETAKADTSNKSNASESKKENTTATTNTSSNKNNSSSSSSKPSSKPSNSSNSSSSNSSKPAEHTHDWVAVTETRTVVDQPAYDEQVPITEMKAFDICNDCGAELNSSNIDSHVKDHMINDTGNGGWHTEWREVVTGYQTVHHDAVTHTETVTTGYRCSTCGATK